MDNFLYQTFQRLAEAEVPASLHDSTYRAAIFWRYKRYVLYATSLVAVTFIFSLWHLYTRTIETDIILSTRAILSTVELSADSIMDALETFFQILPTQAITLTILNFGILATSLYLLHALNILQGKFGVSTKMR